MSLNPAQQKLVDKFKERLDVIAEQFKAELAEFEELGAEAVASLDKWMREKETGRPWEDIERERDWHLERVREVMESIIEFTFYDSLEHILRRRENVEVSA